MKKLPKGARISKGKYVQIRIMHRGSYYHEHIGVDCDLAREIASIRIAEIRRDILLGTFGMKKELPTKKFKDAVGVWFKLWAAEVWPDGREKHNSRSVRGVEKMIENSILPTFANFDVDAIKPRMVQDWREKLVAGGISGTSANRYQVVLSSFFNGTKRLIDLEKISAFKLPHNEKGVFANPCESVEKAPNVRRKRVLSVNELKNLKAACATDPDLWTICEMALLSLLRKKDLFRLEAGLSIDTIQAKTGRAIQLPVQVLKPLNYANFRKRWEAARKAAHLEDAQFRDLRKTGNNLLKMLGHSMKVRQEILGHASQSTTEIYDIPDTEHLKKPLQDLSGLIKSL